MGNTVQSELARINQLRDSGIISEKDYLDLKKAILMPNVESENIEKDQDLNSLKCPRCKSTAITTGTRGFNLWTGFLGSGKTVNRCGSCGFWWYPSKK